MSATFYDLVFGGLEVAKKFMVSMDDGLFERLEGYVSANGFTRSGFISVAVRDYLEAKEKAPKFTSIFVRLAEAVDKRVSGSISDDEYQITMEQLQRETDNLK